MECCRGACAKRLFILVRCLRTSTATTIGALPRRSVAKSLGASDGFFMPDTFQIRCATAADIELISWHRARMFQDMGELPPDLFESFRLQSRDKLRSMFERENYFGWLASPENEPERIVAGAGVQLREVPP